VVFVALLSLYQTTRPREQYVPWPLCCLLFRSCAKVRKRRGLGNALLIVGIVLLLFLQDWRIGVVMGIFALLALLILTGLRNFAVRYWVTNRQKDADFFGFLGRSRGNARRTIANLG
jgi:ABC-type multidrug transport system fused ATPase/permease subunit